MKTLREMLREARIRAGISQYTLAEKLGLQGNSQISRIESGIERISYRHLSRLAGILHLDFTELERTWLKELNQKLEQEKHHERRA